MADHLVIGTAGHVDHGKTALVKALTGVDTDRWDEEKRRGITIDLGFAQLELPDGRKASIVDVPGHEDFVRNMVAGATGVDVALLVVAADEGLMPQTEEHLAILGFLGVQLGVAAVTKSDLVEPEWLELVLDDVSQRLRATKCDWQGPLAVSSSTGQGLSELREALRGAANAGVSRPPDLFRLPVDRVFSVAGAGTVVTGTTWAGSVSVGDQVRLLPADKKARIRSLEAHGQRAESATPGRRTAISLVGLDRADAGRGSVVVSDATWRPTRSVDVIASLLPHARPLTQRSRIRLHVGTSEILARVTPAGGEIEPGGEGVVRLRLEEDLICRWGDRCVLRSYSPVTTIGGAVVVDPWPRLRPRRPSTDTGRSSGDPAERVASFVDGEGVTGLPVADLPVRLGIRPGEVDGVLAQVGERGVVQAGDRLLPEALVAQAGDAVLNLLSDYHRRHPLRSGVPLEETRRAVGPGHLADHVLDELIRCAEIEADGGAVRVTGFAPTLSGEGAEYRKELDRALQEAGLRGLTVAGLRDTVPEETAAELLRFGVMEGTVVRMTGDRYYSQGVLDGVARQVVGEIQRLGEASPAALRDVLGLTRKYLIPLLEWLDTQGVTARDGDVRRLGPQAHLIE